MLYTDIFVTGLCWHIFGKWTRIFLEHCWKTFTKFLITLQGQCCKSFHASYYFYPLSAMLFIYCRYKSTVATLITLQSHSKLEIIFPCISLNIQLTKNV